MRWESFVANEQHNIYAQSIIAFCMGLILSPWSMGWIYFLLFLIVWEILYAIATQCHESRWTFQQRLFIIFISFCGWILGRVLVGYSNPFSSRRKKINGW